MNDDAESTSKGLLKKIRFIEWLSTRDDLSLQDMRLAIALVSLTDVKRGYAWPALEQLARALGRDKAAIHRQIPRLERKGLFQVRRPARPGRGLANSYHPRFDSVPDGNLYELQKGDTITSTFNGAEDDAERVTSQNERVTSQDEKGDIAWSPHPSNSLSEEIHIRSLTRASACADAVSENENLEDNESSLLRTANLFAKELSTFWNFPNKIAEISEQSKDLMFDAMEADDKDAITKASHVAHVGRERYRALTGCEEGEEPF